MLLKCHQKKKKKLKLLRYQMNTDANISFFVFSLGYLLWVAVMSRIKEIIITLGFYFCSSNNIIYCKIHTHKFITLCN